MLNKKKLQSLVKNLELKNKTLENETNSLQEQINEIDNNEKFDLDDVLMARSCAYPQQNDLNPELMLTEGMQTLLLMYDRVQTLLVDLKVSKTNQQVQDVVQEFLNDFEYWGNSYLDDKIWSNIIKKIS